VFFSPGFTLPDGFEKLRNDAVEVFVDYAWKPTTLFEGFWTGLGVEVHQRKIRNEASGAEGRFRAVEPALRAGYIWRPFETQGFYLNPWAGVNIRAAGNSSVDVGGSTFSPPVLTPLLSLKLGWQF